jgi:hypothetical protein
MDILFVTSIDLLLYMRGLHDLRQEIVFSFLSL